MSEIDPQISEQPQVIEVKPQTKTGFSGKQVFGLIAGVLILLAVGLAIGGVIGYRMGAAEGAQQALANRPAAQAPALDQQLPQGFNFPFGQQLPAANPGGPYLGVTFQMITPQIAAQEGITGTTGALVREVVADGPAAKAGLKQGDVVIAVNGQLINSQNDLRTRVAAFKPNDEITLTVVKGTATGPTGQHDVKVTLGERPAAQSFEFQLPFNGNGLPQLPFGNNGLPNLPNLVPGVNGAYLGVEYELITPEVAAREAITGTSGALIKTVAADSPAAKAGLQSGEVISAVDGKAIDATNNLRTIIQNHKSGDALTLTIVKPTAQGPTNQRDVKVTLAARPVQQPFQMPPGSQPGAPSLDSREG